MDPSDHSQEPQRSVRNNWNNQIRRHALMNPDGLALRFLGESTTWHALADRVARFADVLSRRGVGAGDRVLILMLNRPEYLESVLAINALGALAVPVNFRMTAPEVAFLADNSRATLLVTDAARHRRAAVPTSRSCCSTIGLRDRNDNCR